MTALHRTRLDLESIMRLTELADYIIPFTIRAVSELGVADALADGPRSIDDIAVATNAHAPSLYRALRALACKGIFTEVAPRTFALTPMAEYLRSDHPLSLRDAYTLIPADIEAWAHLDFSVRTGRPAFDHVHGCDYWTYMERHTEESERFDRAQQAQTRLELRVIVRALDWSQFGTLIDVGGGNGAFLAGLLSRYPTLKGVLMDRAAVVARASDLFRRHGVETRCSAVAGDFFRDVPPSGDAYLLKRILYGWHDTEAVELLKRVAAAMPAHAKLFIIEPLVSDAASSAMSARYDLAMLVMKGSGSRTAEQIGALCASAGLSLTRVIPTPMFPLIEVGRRS
jgi:hypothetical protein